MFRKHLALPVFLAVFCGFAAPQAFAQKTGLGSLRPETRTLLSGFDCGMIRRGTGAGTAGREALCVGGDWKTVRLRVGDDRGTAERPARMRLEWRSWHTPGRSTRPVPTAADRQVAADFLQTLSTRFLPDHRETLQRLFFSEQAESLQLDDYRIAYSYRKGAKLNRHVLEIVDMRGLQTVAKRQPEPRDAGARCRSAAARATGRPLSALPVQGAPRRGFEIETVVLGAPGENKLFCQLHTGGFYQLREVAAATGEVRILAQGMLR